MLQLITVWCDYIIKCIFCQTLTRSSSQLCEEVFDSLVLEEEEV
ncbi:hypothetical protein A5804_002747 [Enterococcus faecium]|uniref:Uncharacterized protein n=1 Tax=Enterococcus faecium TaxID=1352 RepID=A0AB73PJR7_ENTFC|nr:hypothetical protein A5804_002747 [Enterococcus faecium]